MELQRGDGNIHFLLNEDSAATEYLKSFGFESSTVAQKDNSSLEETWMFVGERKAKLLIIDSYQIRLESLTSKKYPVVIAVIDDMADRFLPADIVVNGGVDSEGLTYRKLPHTKILAGLSYALLREEFSRAVNREIAVSVRSVLITVGGMDPHVLTPRMIAWVREAVGPSEMHVLIGPFFSEELCFLLQEMSRNSDDLVLHRDPRNVRQMMLRCDLAVAGGGQTVYELAATGTPSVVIRIADNQSGNVAGFSSKGVCLWAGNADDANLDSKVVSILRDLAMNRSRREEMSRRGRSLVDGQGTKRVASVLMEALNR